MTYAPILLFVYNRPEHTRQVVSSLLRNKEAADSLYLSMPTKAKNLKVMLLYKRYADIYIVSADLKQ